MAASPHLVPPPAPTLSEEQNEEDVTLGKMERGACITCGGDDGCVSVYTRVCGRPLVHVLAMVLRRPLVELDLGGGQVCGSCVARFEAVADLVERLVQAARECIKTYNTAVRLRQKYHDRQTPTETREEELHTSKGTKEEGQAETLVDEEECLLVVDGLDVQGNQAGIVGRALALAASRAKKGGPREKRKYQCRVCGKVFGAYSHRVEHMLVHTGERDFQCDICGFSATTKSNLAKHRLNHTHPAQCTICNKRLCNKFSLKEHMITHSSERPHQCAYCHKVFRRLRDQRLHERTHLAGGKHECHICNRSFVVKSRLARHMLTHQTDKQFTCQVCQKKFTRKDDLQCHTRIHTGEKPYICHVCGKEFRYASNCRSHVRSHTKCQEPHACCICHITFPSQAKYLSHLKSRGHKKKTLEAGESGKLSETRETSKLSEADGSEHIFCHLCKMSFNLTDYTLHKTICGNKIFESVDQLSDHPLTHTVEHTLTHTAEHTLSDTTEHALTHTDNTLTDSLTHTTESIILSDYPGIMLPLDKLGGEAGVNVVVTVKTDSSPLHNPIISAPSIAKTLTSTTTTTTILEDTNSTTVLPITLGGKCEDTENSTSTIIPITLGGKCEDSENSTTAILPLTLGGKHKDVESVATREEVLAEVSDGNGLVEEPPSPSSASVAILNPSTEFKISDWDLQQYYHKS